jgi:plasmid stabilization system protein ParE
MIVVLAEAAIADLVAIGRLVKADNPRRAETFVAELELRCQQLGDMPNAFPFVPRHESSGVRRRSHRDYLIFYRIAADRVEVLHVLHGAQDYEAVLFPED